MTARPKLKSTPVALVAVALVGTLLSGCSGSSDQPSEVTSVSEPDAEAPAGGATTEPGAASESTDGGLPSCGDVKAALGPSVEGLIELDGSENGVTTGVDGPELACSWFTPETDGSSIQVEEYGGISIGISRDPSYTEESMQPLGWTVQDARVASAGAWALKVGGGYEPAEQLDVTGVQVVRNGVVVVLTSGGVALQDVPQLASLTNEWALGGGVAVLELMD